MAGEKKTFFRKYFIALLTAVLMLLLIGNYVFWLIPQNKKRLDSQYFETLSNLRNNLEQVNANFAKGLRADSTNKKEFDVTVRYSENGLAFYWNPRHDTSLLPVAARPGSRLKLDSNQALRTYKYEDVYKNLFRCEHFEAVAIGLPDKKAIYYYKGSREPNIELIFQNKTKNYSDYFQTQDTTLNDLKYYVYQFKPASSREKIALIVAIKTEDYESSARALDTTRTLFAILSLVLLALMIPLLKSFISDRYENLSISDVIFSTSAIGMLTVLSFVLFMGFRIYKYFDDSETATVKLIGSDLKKNFEHEFNYYGRMTNYLDTAIGHSTDVESALSKTSAALLPPVPALNQKIFRFFRIRRDGCEDVTYPYRNLSKKPAPTYSYNDFSDRDYFKAHKQDLPDSALYFEPLIAWKGHSFRVTVSKKTDRRLVAESAAYGEKKPFISIVTFFPSTNFYYCLPADYSFAVFDQRGKVQMHSDSSKNLSENFIHELENPGWLKKEMILGSKKEPVYNHKYGGEKSLVQVTQLQLQHNQNPLYLAVFKNRVFADGLLMYAVLITLIISLGYNLLIVIFCYFLSAVYYIGHVKFFAAFHFHWMFPNNNNTEKYMRMGVVSIFAGILVLLSSLVYDFSGALFFGFNAGFVMVLIHFLNLTRRHKRGWKFLIELLPLAGALFLIFYVQQDYLLRIILELSSCLLFLGALAWYDRKFLNQTGQVAVAKRGSLRGAYTFFTTSIIWYHYMFVTFLVFMSVIYCEKDRADYYVNVHLKQQMQKLPERLKHDLSLSLLPIKKEQQLHYISNDNLPFEELLNNLRLYETPSQYYLNHLEVNGRPVDVKDSLTLSSGKNTRADENTLNPASTTFSKRLGSAFLTTKENLFLLLASLIILVIVLYAVLSAFAQRFFFFDLRCAADVLYGTKAMLIKKDPAPAELKPPYEIAGSAALYHAENLASDPKSSGIIDALLKNCEGRFMHYPWRLELATLLMKQDNAEVFTPAFDELSIIEKYVLLDLAKDNFANAKNKDVLVSLIQKGFVVCDAETGIIRVINLAFCKYLEEWEEANPGFFDPVIAKESKSSWASWKLPLLIVGGALCMFLMYVKLDFNTHVVSFAGAFVGVLGLILRFTTTLPGGK